MFTANTHKLFKPGKTDSQKISPLNKARHSLYTSVTAESPAMGAGPRQPGKAQRVPAFSQPAFATWGLGLSDIISVNMLPANIWQWSEAFCDEGMLMASPRRVEAGMLQSTDPVPQFTVTQPHTPAVLRLRTPSVFVASFPPLYEQTRLCARHLFFHGLPLLLPLTFAFICRSLASILDLCRMYYSIRHHAKLFL